MKFEASNKELHIKNMMCNCCITIVKNILEINHIKVNEIKLGHAKVTFNNDSPNMEQLDKLLRKEGFALLISREKRIVDQTKLAVVELIHQMNNVNSMVQKSEYLVEKLNLSYQQLSKLFSKHENITLEKFIIQNKIERIKELIDSDEFTLSEIAYMMDYSSVQYLSAQFKKETGVTVSDYKKGTKVDKKSIEDMLESNTNYTTK
jgi:AraC-like DNA-binding protein